jgi:peroxiredoxin
MRLLYLLILIPFLGCTHNPQIIIKGTVPDAGGQTLTLKNIIINEPVIVDSITLGKNGKFRFKHEISGAGFYQLGFSDNNFISLLLEPGESVNIRFYSKNLAGNYSLTGSEGSLLVQELDIHLRNTVSEMDSITTVYKENMDTPGFDSLSAELNDSYTKVLKDQRNYSIGFIIGNLTSLASIKALYQKYNPQTYVLNDIKDLQYMKLVSDSLTVRYPDSKDVLALKADLEKGLSNYNLSQVKKIVNTAEESKLDISLPNLKGDTIKLSSLKGKYVLLSFWASWNQESVTENLDLKKIYSKYKSNGFEIYQVSFDNNKEAWGRAIHFDELPWISVCDTSYPNSKTVQIYNVTKIPSNYFIDKNGSISARDLHGRELRIKLQQVFGS